MNRKINRFIKVNISDNMLIRRMSTYDGAADGDRFELLYHWEAEDWSAGKFIDRIQGYACTKHGTPVRETVDGNAYLRLNYENYFSINLNSPGLVLSDKFRVELEFIVENVPESSVNVIADFGSLASSAHGFMIGVDSDGGYAFNANITGKGTGDVHNPVRRGNTPYVETGTLNKVSFGIAAFDHDRNAVYCICNKVRTFAGSFLTHEESLFDKNFNVQYGRIGRGYASNVQKQTADWKLFKSLKIFKDKREL